MKRKTTRQAGAAWLGTALLLAAATAAAPAAPAAPAPPYKKTILVGGSTPANNGKALVAALASTGVTNPTIRWLIQLEPGTYALGKGGLVLKTYVDLAGAGRGATVITSTAANRPVLSAAANVVTEVRDLTVQNTAATGQAIGLSLASSQARVSRVEVTVRGRDALGVTIANADPKLEDVSSHAQATQGSAIAFNLQNTSLRARRLVATASSPLQATGLQLNGAGSGVATIEGFRARFSAAAGAAGAVVHGGNLRLIDADIEVTGTQSFGIAHNAGGLDLLTSRVWALATQPGGAVGVRLGSTAAIEHSVLVGAHFALFADGATAGGVAATQLSGPVSGSNLKCVGSLKADLTLTNGACQ